MPVRSVTTVLAAVLAVSTVSAVTLPAAASAAPHHPRPAPTERFGTASGRPHLVGKPGNHTRPSTVRSRYPLREPVPDPVAPKNRARLGTAPARSVQGYDPHTSRELPQLRGARETTYANADGTRTTVFSTAPVNYRRPDGHFAAIDPHLVPTGGPAGGWRNAADAVDVRLADRASAPTLARIDFGGGRAVGFSLYGASRVAGHAVGDTVSYPGVLPGVDLRVQSRPGGVKETLVLRSPAAPHAFLFPLRLTGLSARVVHGQVELTDRSGVRRATFPPGFMIDSAPNPATSTGVHYRLVTLDAGQALLVTVDPAWLADPSRVFPALVDPSVSSDGADSSLVVQGSTSRAGGSELVVGPQGGSPAASYLKFSGLVSRLANHTIYGAQLQLVDFDAPSCRPRAVSVHPVTQSWSSTSNFSYPGPSVGPALASKSFAQGFIALGHSTSACPTAATLFNLGEAGRKLVQGWVNGSANNGLGLRASATDSLAWKLFAGPSTVNPPRLFVTHSPYNAKYSIPNPVPEPPVLQNQSGRVKVTVTNTSAESWTPSTYYLAYRAYNADTGAAVTQQRSANLPGTVARGAKVTLTATIKPLPPGTYFLDFTMVHTGGPVFTDEQVPPARIVLKVVDIPPVVKELFPPNGYSAQTLTPQLWARAVDIDAPPDLSLEFKFEVCESDDADKPVNCTTSAYQTDQAYTVPAGRLVWSKTYLWRAFVKDATNEIASPYSALLTAVPQPAVTSRVAGAPYASQDREFDPQTGNFSTVARDATVTTVGPPLDVVRTYNSEDPRTDLAFGAGWTTQYDMRLVPDDDGSGNVVVTYQDGQEVRFGLNPDGSYAPPQGRTVSLTRSGTNWVLTDRTGTRYTFSGTGRLTRISDAALRSVVLTYDFSTGRLAKAQVSNSQTNTAGRALHFTWTNGHVTSVSTDPVGGVPLTWTYSYAGDTLTSACAPDGSCTTYTYAAGSHYRSAVLDERPESYWRLGESTGDSAGSQVAVNLGEDHGTYHSVTLGATGALAGTGDTAATFNGTSSYLDLPAGTVKKSRDAAIEVWFKVSLTGSGGPLVGYQDKPLADASTVGVPVLYVGTDGRLHGQFGTAAIAPISSATRVNDGRWHQAVLSVMGSTQTLYLDGTAAGTTTADPGASLLTVNQVGAAYATSPGSWPGWGTTSRRFFKGSIDEVSVYAHPLGPGAVAAHHAYATAAAQQMTSVVLPSGRVASQVDYDVATDRVSEYTDHNGGTWKVGAPMVYGGDDDLRRGVQVLDPTGRPYLYEYDALAGRMIRSGSPTGLVVKDEDRFGFTPTPSPTPSPTPTQVCTTPDPGDPSFCTIIPPTSDGPVFVGHTLDGMAIRTFSYDERGFQTGITDENGNTVTLGYDDRGNVISKQTCRAKGDCHTEFWTFPTAPADSTNPVDYLPTAYRDARSSGPTDNRFLTTYSYASTGELATQTNPDGGVVRHTYTTGFEAAVGGGAVPPGLLASTTDARGAVTRYAYYDNGDLAQVTTPSGLVTTFTYDELGRKVSQTQVSDSFPGGVTTTFAYDALSRLVSATGPVTTDAVTGRRHQARTTNGYDADGNVTATTVADVLGGDTARTTSYTYDDHGRLARVTDPEGNETSYGYDRNGNRTSMVDPNGNHFEYGYTARNQLAEVRLVDWHSDPPEVTPPPDGVLVLHSYAYDFGGRMVRHTDAMGREVRYAYYGDGLVKSVTLKNFHDADGSTRDYVLESDSYDGAGNLVHQVTGNGTVVVDKTVDAAGRVVATVTDPDGLARRTTFAYDSNGNVTSTTTSGSPSNVPWALPATGQTVNYTYDLAGNLTTQTVTDGVTSHTTTYDYDQRGLMTSATDPRGNVPGADPAAYTTTYGYDELGRETTTTGPAVSAESNGEPAQTVHPTTTVGYDTFGEVVSARDELGNVRHVSYDGLGNPVTTTEPTYTPPGSTTPITPTTTTTYDANGNVASVTDPLGNVTRFDYDQLNRMVTRDEPASTNDERAVWQYTYTRTGEVLSVTDPTGAVARSTYDDLDRQITLTQVERRPVADNFTTRYTYDDAGNLTALTSPSGATTTNVFDAVGELVTTTDPSGVTTRFGYDFAGRQVRISDALGRTSRSDYDALGRLTRDADLDSTGAVVRQQTYDYDPAGNLTSATDPLGHTTTYTYDAANRLTSQTEPVSATQSIITSFGYDAAGDRTRYTDGRGNTTVYTVNTLGLPEKVIVPATTAQPDPADRTWTTGYDAAGNPTTLSAPGGVRRTRTYDAAGRLAMETGAGAETATTERSLDYDLAGRLTSVSAPGGTNTYTYDDRGDLLTASGPSGSGEYSYDADGNMTTRTDAAGTAHYTYVDGRLDTLTDGLTNTTQKLGYNAAGQLATVDYGAGRVRTYGYDDIGRPASDTLTNAAGRTVASITYAYDLNDNLIGKTTTGTAGAAANTYTYDFAGRLTSWNDGTTTTTYAWDASGNRIRAGDTTATYDERDRLLTEGDTTFSYTPRGTLQTQTSSGLADPFSFDAFDRLVSQGDTSYAYDGLDRVDTRTDPDGTADFAYDGTEPDPISDGTATYARGPADELLAVAEGITTRLAISDQHGDVVGDFDPADTTLDALTDSVAFDPFGQVIATSDPGGTLGNLGFQGDYTDPDTGQVDMGARFYDPVTGTFDSADDEVYTTGASILANPYVYGAGDPLDTTDPTGHWPCFSCALHTVTHAVSTAYHVTTHAVSVGFHYAWSAVRTVAHYAWSAATWVYHKAKQVVHTVVHAVTQAYHWVRSKVSTAYHAAVNWARQRAEAAKRAAVALAHRVTRRAKQAVAWAAKHNPIPVIKAAVRPLITGVKHVISAARRIPAQVVQVARNVVKDATKAVNVIYHQAVEAAGDVVENVSKAVQATSSFVKAHAATIAGIAAGAVVGVGCGVAIGWTGVGAVACGAAAGAVGSVVHDLVEGGHSVGSIVTDALVGGAFGALTGGLGSIGGSALGAGARALLRDGVESAGRAVLSAGRQEASNIVRGRLTGGVARNLLRSCNSFTADTGVLMAGGSRKAIQDVRIGDRVIATNPVTGKTRAEPVTDVIVGHGRRRLVALTVAVGVALGGGVAHADPGTRPRTETIVATQGHPFWVDDQGKPIGPNLHVHGFWAKAGDLRPGEWLHTNTGLHATVLAVHPYTQTTTVYNLTVHGIHTFYAAAGPAALLVHNCEGARFEVDSRGVVTDLTASMKRAGRPFTRAGKQKVIAESMRNNGGQTVCDDCGIPTVPAQRSMPGVSPNPAETQIDHIWPRSLGGPGEPWNGRVTCRECNRKWGNIPKGRI